MFGFSDLQIPPPQKWQDFESLCRDLWAEIWCDPKTKKNGRSGQAQNGVDVYGFLKSEVAWHGVQCKGKDNFLEKKLSEKELKAEVKKALTFEPALSEFTLATTGPRDAVLQKLARIITTRHVIKGLFTVEVVFWDDIIELLEQNPVVLEKYYPAFTNFLIDQKQFQGQTKELKNTIGEFRTSIQDLVQSEFVNLNEELSRYHKKMQAGMGTNETVILEALSLISDKITVTKNESPVVEVIPPDKQQLLGLIATSMGDEKVSSLKKFIPDKKWDRDIKFLISKGVLKRKKGILTVPSRVKRNLLSSEEFKKSMHEQWLRALYPLKNHPDVAAEISWHYLQLGEYWKSVEIFIEFASWEKPPEWEAIFCDCILEYNKTKVLKHFEPFQRIRFLHACIKYTLNCNKTEETLVCCRELRLFSKRHKCVWGVVKSYILEADAQKYLGNINKANQMLRRAVNFAQSENDSKSLADAKYNLALHLIEDSTSEAIEILSDCADLHEKSDRLEDYVNVKISCGDVYLDLGNLEEGENCLLKAIDISNDIGYAFGESLAKLKMGLLKIELKDYKKALHLFHESQDSAYSGRYLGTVAEAFSNKGVVLNRIGRHKEAQEAFENAFKIREDYGHWDKALSSLNNVGAMLLLQNKTFEGRKRLQEAYQLATKHGNEFWSYKCQLNIAVSYLQIENAPKRATNYLRKIAEAAERRAANSIAGLFWRDRMFILIENGFSELEINESYQCALRCFKQDWDSIKILHEGAFTKYQEYGNSESAMLILRKYAALAEKENDLETHGRILAQLGTCLMERETLTEVEDLLLQSIRDGRESRSPYLQIFLNNAAEYYNRVSEHDNAAKYYSESAAEAIKSKDYESAFESIYSQACALGQAEKHDESEAIVKEFNKLAKKNNQYEYYVRGLELLGELAWWRNRPRSAETLYRRALEASSKYKTTGLEATIRLDYANALVHNGKPKVAHEVLKDYLFLFDTIELECEYNTRIAEVYESLGLKRQSRYHRKLAMESAIASGDSEYIADSSWVMAEIYEDRGQYVQASKMIKLACMHETDDDRRISIIMKQLIIQLRLNESQGLEKLLEDIHSLVGSDRHLSKLVDAHVLVGEFYAVQKGILLTAFKHFLVADYYAYEIDSEAIGEVEGHMLHTFSLISPKERKKKIAQLKRKCLEWFEKDSILQEDQKMIDLLMMPFRLALRLCEINNDWNKIPDIEFDRIFDEEISHS